MADPFIGEIRAFGFNYPPIDWVVCDGRSLDMRAYQALFAVIGTTYGGNGAPYFNVPNLQGMAALQQGQGPGLTNRAIGKAVGSEGVALALANLPSHNHAVNATVPPNAAAFASEKADPAGNMIGRALKPNPATAGGYLTFNAFTRVDPADTALHASTIGSAPANPGGATQAHPNMQPYLTVNFCIATQGFYPSPSP